MNDFNGIFWIFLFFFFFFKQKTAYEIYQCDWSSDVCSSDLIGPVGDGWEASASYPRNNWNPSTDPQLSRLNLRTNAIEDLQTTILDFLSMDVFSNEILDQKDRKSTRLNSSHTDISRMPSSA